MYIKKKKDKGSVQYQIVESYRDENGKVKKRLIKHLGPIEKILSYCTDMKKVSVDVKDATTFEFGASFVLHEICNALEIEKHIDGSIKHPAEIVNIGKAMKLATIHKCLRHLGWNDISNWFNTSILKVVENINPNILKKQNFNTWLGNFDEETTDKIQTGISESILRRYNLDLSRVIIDFTSVDTYQIVSDEQQLAQRGKSKKTKQSVLKINYALVCSNDGIPLHHTVYKGNINDSTQFKVFSKNILKKYENFFKQKSNLVFVFDNGMNSKEPILEIQKDYKFVASLRKNECKKITTNLNDYTSIERDKQGNEIKAFEFRKKKYGIEFRSIASYHEKTAKLIEQQYQDKIKKVKKELNIIKNKLNTPKWTDKKTVNKRINELLEKYKVDNLFEVQLGIKNSRIYFRKYDFNKKEYMEIKQSWGISFIFTNYDSVPLREIINIYFREKNIVEDCNKMLKSVEFCRADPVRCWVDNHIRAHFLRCTIGLTIGNLLSSKVNKMLKTNLTPGKILDKLKVLEAVKMTISPFNKKAAVLANYNSKNKKIFECLELKNKFKKIKSLLLE